MKKVIMYCSIMLLITTLLNGCRSSNAQEEIDKDIIIGKITIISNGQEYTPIENWIYTLDGFAADGMRERPADIYENLPIIEISDDFQIIIDGDNTGGAAYILYDNNFEEVYRNNTFQIPTGIGTYVLCVELAWGNSEHYSGYQYFFKIKK